MQTEHPAPGPGVWTLDASHCERPHSRYLVDAGFARTYTTGMAASFARYGVMLETLEAAIVDGFVYTSARPIGAPPGAASPPRPVVWLLSRLHPRLRARSRQARVALEQRVWREDITTFQGEYSERIRASLKQAQAADLEALDDHALIEELASITALGMGEMYEHFRTSGACMLPVGDFLSHVMQWTGCTLQEGLAVLTGASPDSVDAVVALDAAADVVRSDEGALALMDQAAPATWRLVQLAERVPAVADWLALVGQRTLTGHDVAELRAIEVPGMLLGTLRERVDSPAGPSDTTRQADEAARHLRSRVPTAHQEAFDELLAEARQAHPLRDARSVFDFLAMGLVRRVLLEVGRRLSVRGRLEAPDHAVDCTADELRALLLEGASRPTAEEVAGHVRRRRVLSCADMPDHLGGVPKPPPPPECFPPHTARVARAFAVYLDAMFGHDSGKSTSDRQTRLTGVGASSGVARGPARVVHQPEDFARVRQGDILVARITTPAYNALLPLLTGIITERGGILSHPAIVSREYGIPCVVGARGAVEVLVDGVPVEIDGSSGTIRILT